MLGVLMKASNGTKCSIFWEIPIPTLFYCNRPTFVKERKYIKYMEKWMGWGWGSIHFSHGQTNSKGVCLMFKSRKPFHIKKLRWDNDGRILCIETDNEVVTICNVYVPNEDFPEFLTHMAWIMDNFHSPHHRRWF